MVMAERDESATGGHILGFRGEYKWDCPECGAANAQQVDSFGASFDVKCKQCGLEARAGVGILPETFS